MIIHSKCGTEITTKDDGIQDYNGQQSGTYTYNFCPQCNKRIFGDILIIGVINE